MRSAAANDIREQKCPDFLDVAAVGEARGHLAAAVTAVGVAPLLHGLFPIEEGDPDGVLSPLGTKQTRELEHDGGGGTTVVRADEILLTQGVVVSSEQDYTGFLAWYFREDVFHGQAADGRVGGERVGLHGAAVDFQFRLDVVLCLNDSW